MVQIWMKVEHSALCSHYYMFHIFSLLWSENSSPSVPRYLRQDIMRTAFVPWRRDWNHLIYASGSLSFLHNNRQKHSQRLSFSLSSHLGNGNLYQQTVGAGGEHEILKSTSLFPPLMAFLPFFFLRPSHTFHQWNTLWRGWLVSWVWRSLVCNKSNISLVSDCRAHCHSLHSSSSKESSSVYILHPDVTPEVEKHQFYWILTLMHAQTKYTHGPGLKVKGEGWERNILLSQSVLEHFNELFKAYLYFSKLQTGLL